MPLVTPYGTLHNMYHKTAPKDAVYIGRNSTTYLGNPWTHIVHKSTLSHLKVDSREEAIEKYEGYARARVGSDLFFWHLVKDLLGKHLVCFCFPQKCHGETLLKLTAELNDVWDQEAWEKMGTA